MNFLKQALLNNFRLSTVSRFSFIINVMIAVIKQFFFMASWYFFFDHYKLVRGWKFDDLLLMYGILSCSIGVVEIFFFGVKELPSIVESSQLDSFLLQPKNIILNVSMSKGKVSSFGDVATGFVALIASGYLFSVPQKILLVLPIGILLIFSLFLYLSAFIFFRFCSSHLIRELCQNAIIIASQPNSAYGGFFKILTMTLIPVGFLSYFPIEFIKKGNFSDFIISFFGTIIFFNIACFLFRRGLKLYESGNLISRGL